MFTFYLNGKCFFHPHKHSKICTHERERERESMDFFFSCDEKDYGIKDAMPCQLSSVWTKAAPSGSTMTNTDECVPPRWRRLQLLRLLLDFQHKSLWLEFRGGGRSAVLLAHLRSGSKKETKTRDLTEIPGGRENGEAALKWICGL